MGEKLELTIPTDWKDITIGIYQDYVELKEKKLPEDEFVVAVVCVLCKVEKKTLERIKYKDLKDISDNLMKLLKKEVKEEKELIKKVNFKGKEYGF